MKWEYEVYQIDYAVKAGIWRLFGGANSYDTEYISEVVNEFGDQGWELVEVIAPIGRSGTERQLTLFFKREKR